MSETCDLFKDLGKISQAKRGANRQQSAQLLVERGISFESKNGGAHLIVTHNGAVADFWPGTGKWIVRGSGKGYRRGVFKLLEALI